MKKSVYKFHSNLIDYAGLFPPAKQNMHDAWQDFCIHRESEHSWMLSNFICPASRLEELSEYFDKLPHRTGPYPLSILGSSSDNSDTFVSGISNDIELVHQFISSHRKGSISVNMFETRFPASVVAGNGQLRVIELFEEAREIISTVLQAQGMIFYELPMINADTEVIEKFIKSVSIYNESLETDSIIIGQTRCGFKMRCGGVNEGDIPAVKEMADVVSLCRKNSVPLKATAGLHHPLRNYNGNSEDKMHGFINLVGAVILANSASLESAQIEEILSDENSNSFSFLDDSFSWQNTEILHAQIAEARRGSFISYGSCSFDEPIDDLKALGIL